jgi:cytochrome c peroxidase
MNRRVEHVNIRLRGGGVLGAALALTAGVAWAQPAGAATDFRTVKPSTERKLTLPETPYEYVDLKLPAHFRTNAAKQFDNMPPSNPVTNAGATLGRVLFYDTRLSATNTVSCASCHHQKNAFASPDRFAKGHEGKLVDRHAMSLANVRYYPRGRFFWDERAPTLEAQVLMPIQSKIEMGNELRKLTETLARDPHYPELFKKAFGSKEINSQRVAKALAQFVRSLVSYQSKYDEGMNQVLVVREDFPNFTAQENRGKTLFLQRCATCHLPRGQSAHFFMVRPFNNGLDTDLLKTDGGLGEITLRSDDLGLFKSPSLRNVEFTAAYMHDGRFNTLEQVVEHYSKGVKRNANTDGRVRAFNFDNNQKAALIAFMKTLSDTRFTTDPKYADPFQ